MTQMSYDNAGAAYLEQLLRAAVFSEAAQNDPEAGRIVAGLMVALVEKGAGDRVEPYLCPSVDGTPSYEVKCFDIENRPISRVEHLDASQAIRAAVGLAATRPDATAAVMAWDGSGHQRSVLLANGSGIRFHFPDGGVSTEDALEAGERAAGIEEPAESVDAHLDGSLAVPDERDIALLLASMIPSATDIADLVVKGLSGRSNFLHENWRPIDGAGRGRSGHTRRR